MNFSRMFIGVSREEETAADPAAPGDATYYVQDPTGMEYLVVSLERENPSIPHSQVENVIQNYHLYTLPVFLSMKGYIRHFYVDL